ncbi:HAD family hydrolase [Geobacter sp. AOG1]|uniref:HAD family hydrolase n=1 Tax=Geobacter sp. AOG1 TaxID=1566346 RepID=UPI001D5011AA|nr:HAD family hydrolase [Geobacter sp. AOG1]GFE58191.1 haloacid dehalogenase [Geobacter sp. AOG1]
MTIKLIIFDLDGTLVDSLDDLTDATNHMLSLLGRPTLTSESVRQLVGQGARRLVERALVNGTEAEVERGIDAFLTYNGEHLSDRSRLYPGVRETLEVLHGIGLPLTVISNKNVALCRGLLKVLGLEGYFAAVLGADSLPFRKPSPEPLLKLLRDFRTSPATAIMVGDSINDVAAGRGAGVVTVGCTYGYGDLAELRDADYRIDELPQLLKLPFFN